MRRREVLSLAAAAALFPAAAMAQKPVRRVGVLIAQAETDPLAHAFATAFAQGMRRLDWDQARNIAIDYRFVGGAARDFNAAATALIAASPEVILVATTPGLRALRRATNIIPLVFVLVTDPVEQGFVQSLAHPGGNITGFSSLNAPLMGKWLQLLKQVAPTATRVAVIYDPATSAADVLNKGIEIAAEALGIRAALVELNDPGAIEPTFAAQADRLAGGVIAIPGAFTQSHRAEIAAAALRHRLPMIGALMAHEGGLISYYFDPVSLFAEAAGYVDRILRGAKPNALPVEQPTKFSLVINLKTAAALGLTIPSILLTQADTVIE